MLKVRFFPPLPNIKRKILYCIYWLSENCPQHKIVLELKEALEFTENLRKQEYRFVTLVSENPNCVGLMGVDETGPDYNWKKRR